MHRLCILKFRRSLLQALDPQHQVRPFTPLAAAARVEERNTTENITVFCLPSLQDPPPLPSPSGHLVFPKSSKDLEGPGIFYYLIQCKTWVQGLLESGSGKKRMRYDSFPFSRFASFGYWWWGTEDTPRHTLTQSGIEKVT